MPKFFALMFYKFNHTEKKLTVGAGHTRETLYRGHGPLLQGWCVFS